MPMPRIFWLSTIMVLAVTLSGCGDSGDEPTAPAQDDAPAAQTEGVTDTSETEPGADEPAANGEMPAEENDAVMPQDDLEPESEAGAGEGLVMDEEDEADTLGESPLDALEEGGALPGEPTRSDIDAILEETERRFEEAQRQIEQQYQELDKTPPSLEPMEGDAVPESSLAPMPGDVEPSSAIEREAERSGELSQSDVDAWLEESERRFEEARRQLDEQFEEAGRSEPGSELSPDED